MTLHQSAVATATRMLSLVLLLSLTINSVTAQTGACLGSFDAITLRENLFSGSYETTREYILCPNTVINVGRLDFSNKLIRGSGQDFLPARPNLIVKCGDSGSRANNCVVLGGDVQIDATSFLGLVLQPTNVRFEGITFGASQRYTLWATQPGDITFVDCVFRVSLAQYILSLPNVCLCVCMPRYGRIVHQSRCLALFRLTFTLSSILCLCHDPFHTQ